MARFGLSRFVAFDTETSGLHPYNSQILEISAVRFVDGEISDKYTTLVRARGPIPEAATKVNGITYEMCKYSPSAKEALSGLMDFCGDDVAVAHNAEFDLKFIKHECISFGVNFRMNKVIDTLPLSRCLAPDLPNHKLGTLLSHFNMNEGGLHRAEADTIGCGRVLLKLMEIAGPDFSPEDILAMPSMKKKSSERKKNSNPAPDDNQQKNKNNRIEFKNGPLTSKPTRDGSEKIAYNGSDFVVFYPSIHEYLLNDYPSKRCTSVTTLVKGFFPEFDTVAVAKKTAAKRGVNYLDLIKEWEEKGAKSSELGSAVHLYAERMLKSGSVDTVSELEVSDNHKPFVVALKQYIPKLLEKMDFLGSEVVVFNPKMMISGTIDLLMKSKKTGNLVILDWKTNEKIDTHNKWQSGLGPLSHLSGSKFNIYSLQCNCYRRIIMESNEEDAGGKIDMAIIHLERIHDGSVVPNLMIVNPMDKEVDEIFKAAEENQISKYGKAA